MPRSARPRKAYRAQPVRLDAHGLAIDLASKLSPDQQALLAEPMRLALDQLRTGRGDWAAWRTLADAGNVAQALAERNIASNLLDKVHAAQAALAALADRVKAGRSWTLRGPELTAIDDMAWVHEVQLSHATQGETAAAIQRVKRVVQGVLQGNGSPQAHIVVGALH